MTLCEHTHEKNLRAGVRRRNKLRQSKIGLPQIVLSFCIISVSERGETEPHTAEKIDDSEGKNRNAADVMGEAVE